MKPIYHSLQHPSSCTVRLTSEVEAIRTFTDDIDKTLLMDPTSRVGHNLGLSSFHGFHGSPL